MRGGLIRRVTQVEKVGLSTRSFHVDGGLIGREIRYTKITE